jgi:hypothetical protein
VCSLQPCACSLQPHASQGSDAVVAALRSRMAALVGYPEAALEPLQAL